MQGINKVILMGYVGNDPECKQTRSGDTVTTFQICTSKSWKDNNGDMQSKSEWHNLVCFKRTAEIAGDYVRKGDPLYIEGELQTTKYTDQNGIERSVTKIVVSVLNLLKSKKDSENNGNNNGNYDNNRQNNNNRNNNNQRQNNNNYGGGNNNGNRQNNNNRNNNQNFQGNTGNDYQASKDGYYNQSQGMPDDDIPF